MYKFDDKKFSCSGIRTRESELGRYCSSPLGYPVVTTDEKDVLLFLVVLLQLAF